MKSLSEDCRLQFETWLLLTSSFTTLHALVRASPRGNVGCSHDPKIMRQTKEWSRSNRPKEFQVIAKLDTRKQKPVMACVGIDDIQGASENLP